MAKGFVRSSSLVLIACVVLLTPLAIYLVSGHTRTLSNDPVQVLAKYLKAAYGRDFTTAYRFVSAQDQRLKSEKVFVRERGAFGGFTLEIGRRLAAYIEATPLETNISGNRARVKLRLKLPDANKLSPYLLDWDEERLNALSTREQASLLAILDTLKREGRLEIIEGEETFELVKESGGWKVFLDWAAGVRIAFSAKLPLSGSFTAEPVQKEVLARPGEIFTIAYRVKNLSPQEISTRITHHVEPEAMAQYLDIVECGLLFPVRLPAGEKEEYSTTYLVRGDLPDGLRRLSVTYGFQADTQ